MGNNIPKAISLPPEPKNSKGGNKLINNDVDYYNLLLVEKGLRPSYLWYSSKDRIHPPSCSDQLEKIHIISPKDTNKYFYILKTNTAIKTKLHELKNNYSQELEGEILGYLYPQKLTNGGMSFWVTISFIPPPNLKVVHLWAEDAPENADLNKFGQSLLKIKTILPSAYLEIKYGIKKFGNPY